MLIVRTVLPALLVLTLTACSGTVSGAGTDATVRITADPATCWTANVGNATQEGCGPKEFPVTDSLGLFSSTAQKKDETTGELAIAIVQDGEVVESNSTSAAFGVVTVIIGQ